MKTMITPESQGLNRETIFSRLTGESPRGKDGVTLHLADNLVARKADGWTKWKNGTPRSYTRASYDLDWPSYAEHRDGRIYFRRVYQSLDGTELSISPEHSYPIPAGWIRFGKLVFLDPATDILWLLLHIRRSSKHNAAYQIMRRAAPELPVSLDETGLRYDLPDGLGHWHPDSYQRGGESTCRAGVYAALATRRLEKIKAEALADKTVWVLPEDSIRAGNCAKGTKAFAMGTGVNPLHYDRAEWLCGMLGRALLQRRSDDYTRRAVQAAYTRETQVSI